MLHFSREGESGAEVTCRVTCGGMMWHYEQGEKARSEWCVLKWFAWQSGSPVPDRSHIFSLTFNTSDGSPSLYVQTDRQLLCTSSSTLA